MTLARLQRASAAIDRGDHASARDLLVAEWRTRRAPELADLVELLSLGTPDALTAQLAAIVTPRVVTSHTAFRRVCGADDPRFARWILDALANPPFCAISAEPFLRALIAELGALRDPRVVGEVAAITTVLRARLTRKPIYERLGKQLAKLAAGLAPAKSSSLAEQACLAVIAAKLDGVRKPARTIDALYADVYADPDDDAPRMVLADLLQERGDPRGEFIQLQLARGRAGERSPREVELLKRHGKQWLGALATVLSFGKRYSSTTFERGFVADADFIFNIEKKIKLCAADRAWSTVETLIGGAPDVIDVLLEHAPLVALRSVELSDSVLAHLARRAQPLPRVSNVVIGREVVDVAILRRLFPALRRLELGYYPSRAEVGAFVAIGVDDLEVDSWAAPEQSVARHADYAAFVDWIVRAPSPIARLSVRPPWQSAPAPDWERYQRAPNGRLERVSE